MLWRKPRKGESSPWKLLLWTAVAGLIFGLIGFGEIAEDLLRASRNKLHVHKASGDIVLVAVDDPSLKKVGRWPWPRRYQAKLTDELTKAGARRIFFDVMFEHATNPVDDGLFAAALERSGRVVLAIRSRTGLLYESTVPKSTVLPMFARATQTGSITAQYNYQNAVWSLDYAATTQGRTVPSFAAALAGKSGPSETPFMIDYSLDPKSIPRISAASALEGVVDGKLIAGKDVIVGATSDAIGDQAFLPGWGRMGGTFVQIYGAETLKAGEPVNAGWFAAFLVALAAAACAAFRTRAAMQNLILGGGAALFLLGPALLEANLIFADVTPGLFVLGIVASRLNWHRWRNRGLVNAISGLPNLSALRSNRPGRNQALIAARVLNYEEIVANLPADAERQLVDQIGSRLRVGAPDRTLYQGDGGIFAWFEEPRLPFGNHIEALYTLFRNPARVNGLSIDLAIAFGVEIGSSRSLANRLASALVAADEAAHDGLKWKYHDPETLEDASWKLSILSQLDSAVEKGEIWVAYQPKLDLNTRNIVGAEALARWTHPEKGPIAASEFIAAAEQHDRIGKLTDFVLEQAISAAAAINREQRDFGVAVNLSAKLLSDKGLVLRLRAMLARHKLPPHLLTLELTETAELARTGPGLDLIASLRDLGITISIDDYGTGLSTLDYLKKIPASEIKIDQSFVKGVIDNRSDRVMVQSTIALAHSLGRKVVAEGVENEGVLDALIEMKCDVAQGYIIGRPMSLESLTKRMSSTRRSGTA